MSQENNGKLIATAVGAAAAGAALAVMAMKLSHHNGNDNDDDESYDPTKRPKRTSILMNDPSINIEPLRARGSNGTLERRDSENLLFPHNHEEKMRRRIATRYTIEEENNTPRQSVTVRVPATSANVGPGCKYILVLLLLLLFLVSGGCVHP
jgi:homoserine kinase